MVWLRIALWHTLSTITASTSVASFSGSVNVPYCEQVRLGSPTNWPHSQPCPRNLQPCCSGEHIDAVKHSMFSRQQVESVCAFAKATASGGSATVSSLLDYMAVWHLLSAMQANCKSSVTSDAAAVDSGAATTASHVRRVTTGHALFRSTRNSPRHPRRSRVDPKKSVTILMFSSETIRKIKCQ